MDTSWEYKVMLQELNKMEEEAARQCVKVIVEYYRRLLLEKPQRLMDEDMQIREMYKSSACDFSKIDNFSTDMGKS